MIQRRDADNKKLSSQLMVYFYKTKIENIINNYDGYYNCLYKL